MFNQREELQINRKGENALRLSCGLFWSSVFKQNGFVANTFDGKTNPKCVFEMPLSIFKSLRIL